MENGNTEKKITQASKRLGGSQTNWLDNGTNWHGRFMHYIVLSQESPAS